ncbi:MAG: hypothetical protein HBSIN02_15820 [Bacteroidia bacterium]|nr:MAG: hypothetical protein HBSIN02_15820 [Bacteroidia bacterium]
MKQFVSIAIVLVLTAFLKETTIAQAPSWSWAVSGGGNNIDNAYRVVADAAGNVYVVGTFTSDTLRLGGLSVRRAGSLVGDFFLAKLNSSGILQWIKSSETAQSATCYGVALDADGNVYIAGSFIGTATFGSMTVTTTTTDAFIAKLTPDGNYVWVQRSTSSAGSSASAYDLFVTADGQVLVTGYFLGAPTLGSAILSHPSNGSGIFAGKLSVDGSWLWALDAGCTSSTRDFYARDIVADADGNVYLTGNFKATATFGTATLSSTGDSDAFVARASPAGQWTWAQKGGGKGLDKGISISTDRQNGVYVAGTVADTAMFGDHTLPTAPYTAITFLAKYDSQGTALSVVKVPGLPGSDIGSIVATDENNDVYLSGTLNFGTAAFGSTIWQGTGAVGIFVAKMNSSGMYEWAQKCGVAGNFNFSFARGGEGALYVLGSFTGSTSVGDQTLTSLGGYDFFIAKLSGSITSAEQIGNSVRPSFLLHQNYPNPFNPSTTIAFDVPSAGAVSLAVFDMVGRHVATLVNEHLQPGRYKTTWNASGMPSGVYLCRLQAGAISQTTRLILVK